MRGCPAKTQTANHARGFNKPSWRFSAQCVPLPMERWRQLAPVRDGCCKQELTREGAGVLEKLMLFNTDDEEQKYYPKYFSHYWKHRPVSLCKGIERPSAPAQCVSNLLLEIVTAERVTPKVLAWQD